MCGYSKKKKTQGDQASIIGGAINFVKELEQLLQCMKGQKRTKEGGFSDSSPFAEFFMFPQYSTRATQSSSSSSRGTCSGLERESLWSSLAARKLCPVMGGLWRIELGSFRSRGEVGEWSRWTLKGHRLPWFFCHSRWIGLCKNLKGFERTSRCCSLACVWTGVHHIHLLGQRGNL